MLYNNEARDLPSAAGGAPTNKDETELCDAFDGDGILLSPVVYDAEVRRSFHLARICAGPLIVFMLGRPSTGLAPPLDRSKILGPTVMSLLLFTSRVCLHLPSSRHSSLSFSVSQGPDPFLHLTTHLGCLLWILAVGRSSGNIGTTVFGLSW